MEIKILDCGCQIQELDSEIKSSDSLSHLSVDLNNLNMKCEKTWKLLHEGKTKGVFQLESNLGRAWCRRITPNSLEELSALTSLIRPGGLKAILDGKSMTQHYADRKQGNEEVASIHPAIDEILAPTYGVLTYQEQVMAISQKIAGFNLQEADELRKGIGKKDPALLAKVGEKFLSGCEKTGIVSKEKAEEVWSYIVKGARYLFNKSHGIAYAVIAYQTAYIKAHFPLSFYTAWLNFAKEKIDPQKEVRELVTDAKSNGVTVCVPSLVHFDKGMDFTLIDQKIYFGPRNVKGIGQSQIAKINLKISEVSAILNKQVKDWTWYEFLVHFSNTVSTTVIKNLILVGAADHYRLSRKAMLYEYEIWSELTGKEQDFIIKSSPHKHLRASMKELVEVGKVNKKRAEIINSLILLLENPSSSLEDTPLWINKTEENLLGVAITSQKIDSCETIQADSTCKEFNDGKSGEMSFCVEIKEVREHIIKKKGKNNGQKMGFLVVEDQSGILENIVLFSDKWEEYGTLTYPGNLVAIMGYRSKQNSLVINKVKQL